MSVKGVSVMSDIEFVIESVKLFINADTDAKIKMTDLLKSAIVLPEHRDLPLEQDLRTP